LPRALSLRGQEHHHCENEIPADLAPRSTAERDKFHRLFELLLKEELTSLTSGGKITFHR
jgi:hypothetical protein